MRGDVRRLGNRRVARQIGRRAYDDPADAVAAATLQKAFPDREIVQVPCRPLIWQNGSLHCMTMQLPRGVLK